MSHRQLVLAAGLGLLFLALLFPPWRSGYYESLDFAFILTPPPRAWQIDYPRLAVSMGLVAVLTGIGLTLTWKK